jgi:hypothetical protein
MDVIWTEGGVYRRTIYHSEADLETAILRVQNQLFGDNRIYLDVKKKIGAKGGIQNVPDGYLIDLSGHKPRLFVVENELASHDPLRHVAVQILQFSLSFEAEPQRVKKIIFDAIQGVQGTKVLCEQYAVTHGFRNLDHMLEWLVFESPFAALVVIDDMPDKLEDILTKKFQFGVEVLELARYQNAEGNHFYRFEPFLADVIQDIQISNINDGAIEISDIDTVVVPAREEGFKETFLRENRWYAIRIHGTMRPQIKYIATYQVAPISAITHLAPVRSIEPWQDSGKYVVIFSESAREINPPIHLVKNGRIKPLYNLRYTTVQKLESAKNLDDVW